MNNFGLTKTPFRRPHRYEFTDELNVKIRLTDKKLWPGKFKQQYFISVQVRPGFLPENNPRLYISLVLRAKEGPNPKTRENSPRPVKPRTGSFRPVFRPFGFSHGSRFRPPPCYTRRPGRSATTRRPSPLNFKASRRRTDPDPAGEHGGSRHLILPFLYIHIAQQPMPRKLDKQNWFLYWHRLWELKQKSFTDDWQDLGSNRCQVALRHLKLGRSPIPHLIRPGQSQCHATQ